MLGNELLDSYREEVKNAERFRNIVCEQLISLFSDNEVTLGVPMESRIKAWGSISEKIERKSLTIKHISELDDFVGVRVILLFRTDLVRVDEILRSKFKIIKAEDTARRLNESQFGYQSQHYVLSLPDDWLEVPSFKGLDSQKAELQVRTLAQHIWAAASHKLQYKNELTVPIPLRRSIHRVSALLETVDLEFERLLSERDKYVSLQNDRIDSNASLNVDILKAVLSELLPAKNIDDEEDYAQLLRDLLHFNICTAGELKELLINHMQAVLDIETKEARKRFEQGYFDGTTYERTMAGVFYTHVGLTRVALGEKVGKTELSDWLGSTDEDDFY